MNNQNVMKMNLYEKQIQLQKQLKSKKDLLAAAKRSYNENKKIAQSQMEMIKKLTEIQNKYYEEISQPPPAFETNISEFKFIRNLINDLDKSYNEIDEESELAFPFDEDITPDIDHYSDLYNQLDEWLQKKEKMIEAGDEQQNIKEEIEKLKLQNAQLKEQIMNEPDLTEQINEIRKTIKERKSLLSSKDEVFTNYQKKSEELNFITDSITESQKNSNEVNTGNENGEEDIIKIDKEVNVQTLNKVQLKCLKSWEQLMKCKSDRQIQETKLNELLSIISDIMRT